MKAKVKDGIMKFRNFMKKDSLLSIIVFLGITFLFLLLIFFPLLRLVTGTSYPLVIVESCSMYHDEYGFSKVLDNKIYLNNNISLDDSKKWDFPRGFNKGDIVFVIGARKISKGDVIIFSSGGGNPIIHRVIDDVEPYQTKGDNYVSNSGQLETEKSISKERVLGKAVFKVPYIGWVKLIFFDWKNDLDQRGLCKIM